MFTTMCPKEQQTSDNLIVKDYCFINEVFDKLKPGKNKHLHDNWYSEINYNS